MLACPHPDVGSPGSQHTPGPAEDHVSWHLALFVTLSNRFVVFVLGSKPPIPPHQATLFLTYFIPLTLSLCHFPSMFALIQFFMITSSLSNQLIYICSSLFIAIMVLLILSSFQTSIYPALHLCFICRNSNTVIQKNIKLTGLSC